MAEQHFAHACQANPRAANVWFLRGYIAWKRRDFRQAVGNAGRRTQNARGRDWKPAGSALEGDVQHRMYSESGFLNVFEQQWDGSPELTRAYGQLDAYLLSPPVAGGASIEDFQSYVVYLPQRGAP